MNIKDRFDRKNTRIILASKSPRRNELLKQAGFDFEIITSDMEEIITENNPENIVKELSLQKAFNVYNFLAKREAFHGNTLVIGADTIVTLNGKIMGKPEDETDAFNMIHNLQGNTHQVFTGITLIYFDTNVNDTYTESFAEYTDVSVYEMSDKEILDYIKTKEPMDKAGAYGIQGSFAVFIEKIAGDYNNVVGLPIARLYHALF